MKSRKKILFALFGVCLLGAIFGWLWVIQRLIQTDAGVAEAKVRVAEERYLEGLVERFRKHDPLRGNPVNEQMIHDLVFEDQEVSGIWTENFEKAPSSGESVKPWPEDGGIATSAELVARQDEFPWGDVEDGRDRLGSLLLRLARKEGDAFSGGEILMRGLLNSYSRERTISPGFRLLMINEILKRDRTNKEISRLKLAEEIRAVEGKVDELETDLEERMIDGTKVFYTNGQLISWLEEDEGPKLELLSDAPDDRNWVKISGFKHWPYLTLKEGQGTWVRSLQESHRAVKTVGVLSVLSTLGVISAAIWLGRREMKLARSRTDLAASVAHELRTPLAGQRVVLENLEKRLDGASKQDQDSVTMALRENLRLGDLAESFLTFSRLDRGTLKIDRQAIELHQVVEQVMDRFAPHWGEEDVVEIEVDQALPLALADEASVATVLRNLVENAWKYSESPRRVRVSQVETRGEVGLSVTDNGSGLSKQDQLLVFRQFFQVDRRLNRSQGGLGLGLSIVKRLMEGMSGRIEIESDVGKGTTFRVYFEKAKR